MDKTEARPKNMVELKPGVGGYVAPGDPRLSGPPLRGEVRKPDRMCMKARSLTIESDGTPEGTVIIVDGVHVAGCVRFEMAVQKGYPRASALMEMTYVKENLAIYAEEAGNNDTSIDNKSTVTVDVFKRS